jgi:hypothetical protein
MGTSFKTNLHIELSKIIVLNLHVYVLTLFHLTNSQQADRVLFYGDDARVCLK